MASSLVDLKQEGALVFHDHSACFHQAVQVLQAHGLPDGLLPLDEIQECGYVETTGYFWVKQKSPNTHYFKGIGRNVSYAKEISGYFEDKGLKKLTGVKAKELLIWVSIVEITTSESHAGQIFFKSAAGIGKWYPAEAFALQL